MKRFQQTFLFSLSLVLMTSCYFEEECDYNLADSIAGQDLRNPESGQCETFGGGGGGSTCGSYGGGKDSLALEAPQFVPDWGACYGACDDLDETACLVTDSCRGAYTDNGNGSQEFFQCWSVSSSGPVRGGDCTGLDAQTCSLHDDCSAVHAPGVMGDETDGFRNVIGEFERCIPEEGEPKIGCYGDSECGPNAHCNAAEICLPSPSCGSMDPIDEQGDEQGDEIIPCDGACYGYCVPDTEPAPGTCYGEVLCEVEAPRCPQDTRPGVVDGCWSGYCIPLAQCEMKPVCDDPLLCECPALSEEACISQPTCDALYEGVDCSCQGDACECSRWEFESCSFGD